MIRLLEKHVSDKIAAGEVVDRPLSVVKELVENSIDAGADNITVEIKKGGKEYIRVSDNGCGIKKDEVLTAFKRHATSKIVKAEDLNNISTLGFRGEALASISAVSRTTLITRTEDENSGVKVQIDGSMEAQVSSFGCDKGTSLVVTDLFYNTPARLKFMKSDQAESTLIIDFVSQIALCYPNIKIKMINNGSILFKTPGNNDRLSSIATIYGRVVAKSLVPVSSYENNYKISGFVSNTGESRNSRKNQIFFVNGRVIQSKVLTNAVKESYKERLFPGRFPIAFLFLKVPAETLDVNIHPNKREVRFDDDKLVEDFTKDAIKNALTLKEAAPEITEKSFSEIQKPEKTAKVNSISQEEKKRNEIIVNESPKEDPTQIDIKNILSNLRNETKAKEPEPVLKTVPRPFEFDELIYQASVFGTYIITSDETYMYLIDQHAAHERVFYEKLMHEFNSSQKEKQIVMIPILLDIPASVTDFSFLENLSQTGFTIEEFGSRTYKVSEIPVFMTFDQAEIFLKDYISSLNSETDFSSQQIKDTIAKKACKAAVKGNHTLKEEEVIELLRELSLCDNPFSCPHGRPTYIRMSKSKIEGMFKRV